MEDTLAAIDEAQAHDAALYTPWWKARPPEPTP